MIRPFSCVTSKDEERGPWFFKVKMPRNRMIKPDFWADEKISKISFLSRLAFIGIWNFCDDSGVCRASSGFIRSQIFQHDDLTLSDISKIIDELVKNNLIIVVESEAEKYLLVRNFKKHQKIDKPSQFRFLSSMSDDNALKLFNSSTTRRLLTPLVVDESTLNENENENEKEKEKGRRLLANANRDEFLEFIENLTPRTKEVALKIKGLEQLTPLAREVSIVWNQTPPNIHTSKINSIDKKRAKKLNDACKDVDSFDDWCGIFTIAAEVNFIKENGERFVPNIDTVLNKYISYKEKWDARQNEPEEVLDEKVIEEIFKSYQP